MLDKIISSTCKLLLLFVILGQALTAHDGRFGLSVNGGLAFPMGNFGEIYKLGFGINSALTYNLEESTELGAVIGYFTWSFDNAKFNAAISDAGISGKFDLDAPIQMLPLLIQVKFKVPREDFKPYFLLEGGIYYTSVRLSGSFSTPDTVIAFNEPTTRSSEAGMSFAVGAEIPASSNLEVDVRVTYHLVPTVNIYNFGSLGYQKDVSTNKFLSVFAGVNYLF